MPISSAHEGNNREQPPKLGRGKSDLQAPRGLSVSEIEALLKLARSPSPDRKGAGPAEASEELGPGDVQYFRGHSMNHQNLILDSIPSSNWPESSHTPDLVLQQVEQQLAGVIDDSNRSAVSTTSRLNESVLPVRGREPHAQQVPPIQTTDRTRSGQSLTLEDLGNVELDISIELGRTEILIEDVLKLREGSVVSLDKLAGDPVDIVANGRLVARGELLVIDGKFGVRLSEVL